MQSNDRIRVQHILDEAGEACKYAEGRNSSHTETTPSLWQLADKLEHLKGGANGKPQIQRVEFPLVSCSF